MKNFLKNDPILKIKESIDVYTLDDFPDNCKIQFYHINSRQKLSIRVATEFSSFLSALDGINPVSKILATLKFEFNIDELESILKYLYKKGILEYPSFSDPDSRYSRQINFLADWISGITAQEAHNRICNTHCVIFGVGAVGSSIAINLARAGLKKITLIDYKALTSQSFERHPYFSIDELGEQKVYALKRYLKLINSSIDVICFNHKLLPSTPLKNLIDDASFVVNTADEPYIGHTSIKLGRYLWQKNIPLYVAGGFDAHLMSTGDFYIPKKSTCVDCSSNFFTKALSNWKPNYKIHESSMTQNHIIGGSGGFYSMSLFSASYACIQLINYIAGGTAYKSRISQRGEYSSGIGEINWIKISPKEKCEICGK